MAHTKAQRAVRGNRDGNPKYRGVKKYGGEAVIAGNVILRQVGSVFHPGDGVAMGRDFTLMSLREGVVNFYTKKGRRFVRVIEPTQKSA